MSWPYTLVKTAVTGDLLLASDYNNEHQNHINNNIPASIDDTSNTLTDMRTQVDPAPSDSPAAATTLAGEIQQIRYKIAQILGKTYWYNILPSASVTNADLTMLGTYAASHTHQGPSGSTPNGPTLNGGLAIAAGTITADRLVSGTITTTQIAASTITGSNIADGTITGAKIASATITNGQIANNTVGVTQITAGAAVKSVHTYSTGFATNGSGVGSGSPTITSVTAANSIIIPLTVSCASGGTGVVTASGFNSSTSINISVKGPNTDTVTVTYLVLETN